MDTPISSTRNSRVRAVARLAKPRARTERGLLVVEGFPLLTQAVRAGWTPHEVFHQPGRMTPADHAALVAARDAGAITVPVTEAVIARMSRRDGPLACVATILRRPPVELSELPLSPCPLVVVAQSIEKPGNLGVIARSASAAGAHALVVTDPRTDVLGPGCVHASLGSVFSLPIAVAGSAECLRWLKDRAIMPVVTTPQARCSYTENNLAGPLAIVVGNEHTGVSPAWLAQGLPVRIDMVGPMNSLNASVAAAVVLFEAVRQRGRMRADADDDPGGVRTRSDVGRAARVRASA